MAQAGERLAALGGQQVSWVVSRSAGRSAAPRHFGFSVAHSTVATSAYFTSTCFVVCPLQVLDFDFAPFAETAVLLYGAAFVAERYAGAGPLLHRMVLTACG